MVVVNEMTAPLKTSPPPTATEILIQIVLNPTNVTVYQIQVTNPEVVNIIIIITTDHHGITIEIITVDVVDHVQGTEDHHHPIREVVDVGQDLETVEELGQVTIVLTENHQGVEKGKEVENYTRWA